MSTLFSYPKNRQHKLLALALGGVLLFISILLLPYLTIKLPAIQPFLPIYLTCVFLLEGLTAFLLLSHFLISRVLYLGVIAAAYLFVVPMAAIQILVFPGVFTETDLLNAGPQSAIWIWVFWHAGFPAIMLLAFLTERDGQQLLSRRKYHKRWLWFFGIAPMSFSILLALFATRYSELLPNLISANNYRQLLHSPYAVMVWVINILAVGLMLWRSRDRGVMSVWLSLALFVSLLAVTLTLLGGARFSVGWYAARVGSILSATVLLGVLLWEINRLYHTVQKDNEQLYQLSMIDALTGSYNRRYLDKRLPQELALAARQRNCLALLVLDVDHFKRFNDQYGHLAGDQCLQHVAKAMQDTLQRPADFVARYGGEEFIIVLPDTDVIGAQQVAERIRLLIAKLMIPLAEGQVNVTASIGVAVSLNGETTTAELIDYADQALYHAKAAGRNNVQLANALL